MKQVIYAEVIIAESAFSIEHITKKQYLCLLEYRLCVLINVSHY